jgi:AcrR family transcriptional regulator
MIHASKNKPGRPRDESLATRRCAEILGVAAQIFAKNGYRATDVQWIADELKIGKGTVYRYFQSKRELFLAAVDHGVRQLHEELMQCAASIEEPLARIVEVTKQYLAFFDTHPEMVELIIQERAEFKDRVKPTYFLHCETYAKPWQELFRGLIAAGRVRAIPVERITNVGGDLLYGTIFTNYFAGRRESLELQAQNIIDIMFFGILSDTERAAQIATENGS